VLLSTPVGLKASIESEDVEEPSEPKTIVDADINISSNFEDDDEEDLVRFEDVMSVASCTADALEAPQLSHNISMASGNESFPFHLIEGVTHLRLLCELSPKSSETEYNSNRQTSISIVSPQFKDFYQCDGSENVGWHRDMIILLSSNSNSDVEILD